MALFLFVLILGLINSTSSNQYEYNNDTNISQCLEKIILTEKFSKEDAICFLYSFKLNANSSCDYLNNTISGINNDTFKRLVPKEYFEVKNITFLYNITEDIIANKSNTIIDDIFNIIKGNNSQIILDNLIIMLNETNITFNYIIRNLSQIFKIQEVYNLYNYTYQRYNKYFIDFIELFARDTKFSNIISLLNETLSDNKDYLKDLFYKLIEYYGNKNNMIVVIRDFILETNEKNDSFLKGLKQLEEQNCIFKELSKLINLDDPIIDKILKEILTNNDFMIIILGFLQNNTFVNEAANLVLNLENNTYIMKEVPKIIESIKNIKNVGQRHITVFLRVFVTIGGNLFKMEQFKEFIGNDFINKIKDYLLNEDSKLNNELSQSCIDLLSFTFFEKNNDTSFKEFRWFFVKKFFLDMSKNKNDFLTYENCLAEENFKFKNSIYGNVTPVFLIGIVNDFETQKRFKKSFLHEKFSYLHGLCLPYGRNISNNEDLCSQKDYNDSVKLFSSIVSDMNTSKTETIILNYENIKLKIKDYFYFILSILIMIFPLLIKFFLFIYKNIKAKKAKKVK